MKAALRTLVRTRLRTQPQPLAEDEAGRVLDGLSSSPEWQGARVVFAYVSVGFEMPTRPAIERAWDAGKRVAVPRVLDEPGRMEAVELQSFDELTTGYRNLFEPTGRTVLPPESLDLVLTPGVAFDRGGGRLGQGGGFYDRYLAVVRPAAKAVALAFSAQIVDSVPTEPHDRRLDAIITPTEIYRPR